MSMERVVMLSLPHAGGSAYHLQTLGRHLPRWIDFQPVDLPGHGGRMAEPLLTSLHDMVADVRAHHFEVLSSPHILFGHSMGGTLAYLLARAAHEAGEKPPLLLVVSGRAAPPVPVRRQRSRLPRPEFFEDLRRMGGMQGAALECDELLDLFEPILRADFAAVESYRYQDKPPLHLPLLILSGEDDDISAADLEAWRQVSDGPMTFRHFPGGHFFLFDHARSVAECIAVAAEDCL